MKKIEISALKEDQGKRLDKFLLEKLVDLMPVISRSRVQDLMGQGAVLNLVSGTVINDCSGKIKGNENFVITFPENKESPIEAQNIDFEIIFEDEEMLVINKPAGLITHPGNGNHDKTLVNALLFRIGDSLSGINGVNRPGIVHRLDKDTSGLMVVAKTDLAHQNLAAQLVSRSLKRSYLALCYGAPKPAKGIINKNIDRSHKNRLKMTIVKTGGKNAITHYEMMKSYFGGLLSLVKCQLDTGRTHQIRVHLNEIGCSLVGDQMYSGKRHFLGSLEPEIQDLINHFPRQFLHSYKIAFLHPKSGEKMEFEIPLAPDLQKIIDKIS